MDGAVGRSDVLDKEKEGRLHNVPIIIEATNR